MPRYKEPFSIHRRKLKKKNVYVYYYRTYDEHGRRTTERSTGKTSRTEARKYCMELLRRGELIPRKKLTFEEAFADFWIPEKCEYVRHMNSGSRPRISLGYAKERRRELDKFLIPFFEHQPLEAISSSDIRRFVVHIREEKDLSVSSANNYLANLKILFKWAVEKRLVHTDPTVAVQKLQTQYGERGILTPEEVRTLLDPAAWRTVWNERILHYTLNLLAATTGIRRGEALGLKAKYVHKEYLEIKHSYTEASGLKETKTNRPRTVPIPPVTSEHLAILVPEDPELFLFSTDDGKTPMNVRLISTHLYAALARIEIEEEERKERGITFHSWRHFFNTFVRGAGVSDIMLRSVTGHATEKMTEHYTHFDLESVKEVYNIQKKIIPFERISS